MRFLTRCRLSKKRANALQLDADPPTATVAASFSKGRRSDTQVLHPELARRLKIWLAERKPAMDEILFPVSDKVPGGIDRRTSKMMQLDLDSARATWIKEATTDDEREERERTDFLKYKDSQGRFADFHANRHTFITNLSRAKVSPKVAQMLARHSDIRLTMGIYTHTDLAEKQTAVEALPTPWEYIGSKPETFNGVSCPQTSQPDEQPVVEASASTSTQTATESGLVASCRQESQKKRNILGGGRTHNLRLRRSRLLQLNEISFRVQNP